MNTLIAYGTKYGCAEKCAKRIAEELKEDVELVDLRKTKGISLSGYDKVIIGGSIYIGKIQKEVSDFCSRNLEELKNKKIGLFICGMAEGEAADAELNSSFPAELLNAAAAKGFLGGEFLVDNMNFMDKLIVKKISKVTENKSNILEDRIAEFAKAMK